MIGTTRVLSVLWDCREPNYGRALLSRGFRGGRMVPGKRVSDWLRVSKDIGSAPRACLGASPQRQPAHHPQILRKSHPMDTWRQAMADFLVAGIAAMLGGGVRAVGL